MYNKKKKEVCQEKNSAQPTRGRRQTFLSYLIIIRCSILSKYYTTENFSPMEVRRGSDPVCGKCAEKDTARKSCKQNPKATGHGTHGFSRIKQKPAFFRSFGDRCPQGDLCLTFGAKLLFFALSQYSFQFIIRLLHLAYTPEPLMTLMNPLSSLIPPPHPNRRKRGWDQRTQCVSERSVVLIT